MQPPQTHADQYVQCPGRCVCMPRIVCMCNCVMKTQANLPQFAPENPEEPVLSTGCARCRAGGSGGRAHASCLASAAAHQENLWTHCRGDHLRLTSGGHRKTQGGQPRNFLPAALFVTEPTSQNSRVFPRACLKKHLSAAGHHAEGEQNRPRSAILGYSGHCRAKIIGFLRSRGAALTPTAELHLRALGGRRRPGGSGG